MLRHPAAVKIRKLGLENDPPFVALDWIRERPMLAELAEDAPVDAADVVSIGLSLAQVLAEAHRLGLVHGKICPQQIRTIDKHLAAIDFTNCVQTQTVETDVVCKWLGNIPAAQKKSRSVEIVRENTSFSEVVGILENARMAGTGFEPATSRL